MIVAAADGSSLSNPGPAGWAWYVADDCWAAGGWPRGTNNMGELMAVVDLLRQTAQVDDELRILCDSQYVINAATRWLPGWKRKGWRKADGKPVLNVELLQQLDAALAGRRVTFDWVKGHAGHALNEAADARARAAATAFQRGTPVDTGPGFPRAGTPARGQSAAAAPPSLPVTEAEPQLFSLEPAGAGAPEPPGPSLEDVLVGLERQLLSDPVRDDATHVAALLHPQFAEVGAAGRLWSRGRLLASLGRLDEPVTVEPVSCHEVADGVALLLWRARGRSGVSLRSSLWMRVDGRWLLRFHQGTPTE